MAQRWRVTGYPVNKSTTSPLCPCHGLLSDRIHNKHVSDASEENRLVPSGPGAIYAAEHLPVFTETPNFNGEAFHDLFRRWKLLGVRGWRGSDGCIRDEM
ncbi:hypothetical protein JTB14_007904 [Gonioctena quinquepunctata]|nr:hypothetical protein JTB14_007904 [Gonioctena quinquepunctata]